MDAKTEPLSVTVPEALRIVGIGRTMLYELIKNRKVRAVKIGRRTLVRYDDLQRLVESTDEREMA